MIRIKPCSFFTHFLPILWRWGREATTMLAAQSRAASKTALFASWVAVESRLPEAQSRLPSATAILRDEVVR